MCKMKNGKRLLHYRKYKYLSGKHFHFLRADKKNDRLLTLELVNNKGNVDFTLINRTNNEEKKMVDIKTGLYTFDLNKSEKYLLIIRDYKSSGSRKIYIEKKEK